ncbi:MAG: SDR family oxidoreductase [Chloroflexota bacterium]
MDLGLRNAKVLVTAASQGLGAATARVFSEEGAIVSINSRSPEKIAAIASEIKRDTGSDVFAFAADVTANSAAAEMVRAAAERMGGLDVLVTNAGGPPPGTFETIEHDQWEAAVQLNFLSAVTLVRAALPYLKQSNQAAVLTITSISAKQSVENLTLSNSVRPAVIGLTKTLSEELGSYGIRVNSILPGVTDTERVVNLMQGRATKNETDVETEYAKAARATAIGRIGTPREFANAAVFLCSPAAAFITGVPLLVDGGASKAIL